MKVFNNWYKDNYGEIPMNKNNKKPLQFTELTPDDISTHEDLYIGLLTGGAVNIIPNNYMPIYYDYSINELEKAKGLFQKTFK